MDYPDIYVCKRRLVTNGNVKHIAKMKIERFPHNDNGDLICSICSSETDYLWDINNKYMCPLCAYKKRLRLSCNTCGNVIGCASCGGSSNLMLDYGYNTLICFNNSCLSSFRLFDSESLKCTCINDCVNDISQYIAPCIMNIVSGYLGNYNRDTGKLDNIKFRDIDPNRCYIHQIMFKHSYVALSRDETTKKKHLGMCPC